MLTEETSQTTESPTGIVDLTSLPLFKKNSVLSATPESLNQNKKKNSTTKSRSSQKSFPAAKSSATLAADSPSNAKGLTPYWNELCKEKVSQFASPTEIASLASASISLNASSPDPVGKSWCSIKSKPHQLKNSHEISVPSSLFSVPVSTVCEITKTRKILLRPSQNQRQKLKQWAGCYRFVFNWTVSEKEREYLETSKSSGYFAGRKQWIETLLNQFPWLKNAPAHTIYGAMMDADRAYKATVKKRSKGIQCELPRCRKRSQRSFFILGNAIQPKGIYPRLLGKMRSAEPLPNKPSDSRILFECGRWYLAVPMTVPTTPLENQEGTVVALDPGVRTFLTGFSNDRIFKIGQGAFGRIVRLAHHLDDLLSRAAKANSHRKKRMLQAASKMRRKIRRLVEDMHYQAIGWLLRNYQTVIFPEGNFTPACKKAKRKIGRKSVRALMTWAFATFRDRLIHKAKCLGRNVIIGNEAYTSKTAFWSGQIVQNLGSKKIIKSNGLSFDRDLNASVGIFLRSLVDHPVAVHRNCYC